jgi:hypothetical protein
LKQSLDDTAAPDESDSDQEACWFAHLRFKCKYRTSCYLYA